MSTPEEILNQYKDKIHIYNVMTSKAADVFSTCKSFLNVPIIVASSAMSIINSSFDPNDMKIPNIVLNCFTALMVSLIANFKVVERANNFKTISLKFLKLQHYVEDKLVSTNIDIQHVREVTRQYDDLLEQTDQIPRFIKKKIFKMYVGKKHLPNILCELSQESSQPLCNQQHQVQQKTPSIATRAILENYKNVYNM